MQPTDGLHMVKNYHGAPLPDWEESPLLTDVWTKIMNLLPVPHLKNMGKVNKYFCILGRSLEYQRCRRVYHNITRGQYETTTLIPIGCINCSLDAIPATLCTGQKYIALQEQSGLLRWFDICTGIEKGRFPLERPQGCTSLLTPLLYERNGLLYAYFSYWMGNNRTPAALLRVVCPKSNKILSSHTFCSGPTKNTNSELFKIFNNTIYIREDNKSIRTCNPKNMGLYEILTDFSAENTLNILGFDMDKDDRLHMILSDDSHLIVKSIFDTKVKEKIVRNKEVLYKLNKILEVEIGLKIKEADLIKMDNTHIYIGDCLGELKKIEVDVQEKTAKIIKFQGVVPNNKMQFEGNHLFIIDEGTGKLTISNIHNGTLIGEISKPLSLYNGITFNTALCVKDYTVTYIDGKNVLDEKNKEQHQTSMESFVIKTISFDTPPNRAAEGTTKPEESGPSAVCKRTEKKGKKCSIQ